MSIISDLQHEALDEQSSLVNLLRKALLVANKLNLHEFEKWIECELNGYDDNEDTPAYRDISGTAQVYNPMRGHVPLEIQGADLAEKLTHQKFGNPISEIENYSKNADASACVRLSFGAHIEEKLMASMNFPLKPSLRVEGAQLKRIADAVRTAVLQWALKLEKEGIVGEGLTFTAVEKKKAAEGAITFNIGQMTNSQLQTHTVESTQTLLVTQLDLQAVAQLIPTIEAAIAKSKLEAKGIAELRADVQTIRAQLESPKPKHSLIKDCLVSIRDVLKGAAAEAAVIGAVEGLKTIVGA